MTLRSKIGLISQPWHNLHTLCPMPYRLLYLITISKLKISALSCQFQVLLYYTTR